VHYSRGIIRKISVLLCIVPFDTYIDTWVFNYLCVLCMYVTILRHDYPSCGFAADKIRLLKHTHTHTHTHTRGKFGACEDLPAKSLSKLFACIYL
jgi:hypothetical protein